jgi:hypothetical protein
MDNQVKELILKLLEVGDERRDSLEIGNSKTGQIKVYVDFTEVEEARKKIDNAIMLLKEKRDLVYNTEVKKEE